MAKPTKGTGDYRAHTRYVDIPELGETFATSVEMTRFDGSNFHIELSMVRYDEPKPPAPPKGRRYPVVRLVLPPAAMIELTNRLNGMLGALEQQGLLKQLSSMAGTPPTIQ